MLEERGTDLRCTVCGKTYPVAGGIPRFVGSLNAGVEQVQQAFDFEHRRHDRSVLTRFGPQLVDQFLADCRIKPEFFRGKLALDAGCGSGRWTYALARLGANVTAVDLTEGGIESAHAELAHLPTTSFAQADIFDLPFEPETFDYVMSWGVLHHTPDTRAAFERLVPLVKPGGTLYVMVYERPPALVRAGTEALRLVLRRLPAERRYAFCRNLVVDADRHPRRVDLLNKLFMIAAYHRDSPSDPETYQFGLFDAYSPKYNHVHTRAEVSAWFRDSGFSHITVVDSPHGAVKVRGVKAENVTHMPQRVRAQDNADATWVHDFEERHGRPPRVLHVGNIANNGYLNAKIQRREGIEADVVSYDYYHIMGCPEWEDADFVGDVDEFYPDWWSVDLGDWERPRWFVQGPMATCAKYLLAKASGDAARTDALWRRLERETWLICRGSRLASTARAAALVGKAVRHPRRAGARAKAFLRVTVVRPPQAPPQAKFFAHLAARKGAGLGRAAGEIRTGVPPRRALARHVFPTRLAGALTPEDRAFLEARAAEPAALAELVDGEDPWVARFRSAFPGRPDQLTTADLVGWRQLAELWQPVFEHYDIVQAYATYPIIPLLGGTRDFTAYEHGTLRDIPFEDSPTGRVTALGYREAPVVFVTNADDLDAATALGIPDERVVALPHAVDTQKLEDFAASHADNEPAPESQITFFAPARHDWVDGFKSQLKGNDRVVRAVRLLLDEGRRVQVIFIDWGRHADDTRELITELDCESSFAWLQPLRKNELWTRYMDSHAVLDQFVMEAIGGVTFEAMALGRRVITALDADVNTRFFGAAPPLLAAMTPEEIADAMRAVIDDPTDEAGLGQRARGWVEQYHSSQRIVALQAQAYARVLGARQAP